MELLRELFTDYTLRTVALGAALIGLAAGALGVFALLRRQSLLGDAMSHAALPGVAAAFLFTMTKDPLALLVGALAAGWLGSLLATLITRMTRLKNDAALGIVLAVFFAAGMVLLGYIQSLPTAAQAGLDKYLFGNASTLLPRDVAVVATCGALALLLTAVFWKEFKLLSFDYGYAQSLGWPVRLLDTGLTTLIVLAIVIGLQAVGVVLMSALLVAPAAAARQWSNRLSVVVWLAAAFGALSGVSGAVASAQVPSLPTGPAIVLVVSAITLLSLLLAPARGVVWSWLRHRRQHGQVLQATVLAGMYALANQHENYDAAHDASALDAVGIHAAGKTLPVLERRGLVARENGHWRLTGAGRDAALAARQSSGGGGQ